METFISENEAKRTNFVMNFQSESNKQKRS